MKKLALEALDAALDHTVSYADTRVMEIRDRQVSTKNGKTGHVSSSVSMGLAIRVLANGCWGFAATDDLTREGVQEAAALAREIARAGTFAKKHDVVLAPEDKYEATWVSPIGVDPFTIPVDRNVALLLDIVSRTAPQPRRDHGRRRHELRTPPPGLRLLGRQPHRSDPLPERRGLRGAGLQRHPRTTGNCLHGLRSREKR